MGRDRAIALLHWPRRCYNPIRVVRDPALPLWQVAKDLLHALRESESARLSER